MSQVYTDDCFAGGHAGQTDLQNMENNFASLKSSFSGATQPSNVVAGMFWLDTTNVILKYRNSLNSEWFGVMHGDVNQKIWVYRNSAMSGWVVDSSVSDKVLALKGGSTYTTGAATAGSWTVSGLTVDGHTHGPGTFAGPSHAHTLVDSGSGIYGTGDAVVAYGGYVYVAGAGPAAYQLTTNTGTPSATAVVGTSASGTGTIPSDGTWRAAAAVGTLQYLNI